MPPPSSAWPEFWRQIELPSPNASNSHLESICATGHQTCSASTSIIGPTRAGWPTVAPAGWRRRTRWPLSASVPRTAGACSSATSSSAVTACPSCCTTTPWSAPPTGEASQANWTGTRCRSWTPALGTDRATAARRHRPSPPSPATCAPTTSCWTWRSNPPRDRKRPPAAPWLRPLITSFQPLALAAAREPLPGWAFGLLLDELWDGWFDVARQLQCAAIVLNHARVDRELVARLHGERLRVGVYTPNSQEDVRRMVDAGVDMICTDSVASVDPRAA